MSTSCDRLLRHPLPAIGAICLLTLLPSLLPAQDSPSPDLAASRARTSIPVPPLIQFSNIATDDGGTPLSGRVNVTFSLFATQRGGDPLWKETQTIDVDPTGHYSVQLGVTQPAGIPAALFTSGEPRWLAVQIGEQPQQARVLLVSVPYALKAADAQTLGGLPPAAFLRSPGFQNGAGASLEAGTSSTSASTHSSAAHPPLAGTGTVNFVPLWTPDVDTLGSSILFQSGSGSTAKIGVGNTNPGAKLDVSGAEIVHGTLKLPAAGSANAAGGKNSQPLTLVASSFNSSTSTATNEGFTWQADAANNNTSSPGATLHLLFAQGTAAPAETELSIGQLGNMQFEAPGTAIVVHQASPAAVGILSQATRTGASTAVGVSGTAAGDSGIGVAGTASGAAGKGVIAQANGANGIGLSADAAGTNGVGVGGTANGPNGKGVVAVALGAGGLALEADADAGTAADFSNGSTTHPALTVTNRNTSGSVFVAVSGAQKLAGLDLSTGFTLANNGAITTLGNVGCSTGFVGISFGGTVGCDGYSIVGNGATTILNRASGGRIDFREGNNTEVAISAGGRVGIGTVSPGAQFDVLSTQPGTHSPQAQFGSAPATDSNSVRVYNGSGLTELFEVGKVNNFVQGSAVGDGGLRVSPGKRILLGDSGAARMTIDASGNVTIKGNLAKGGGSFKIDHPVDPMNKYLYHSFVESPDMMNVYNGNIITDKHGVATVLMPDYFEALNRDFRYQLTVIGQFAQAIVAQEIDKNHFIIKTNKPGVKVSWQVTGIRQDAYANAHRIPIEEEKPEAERGRYLHPDAFGVSPDQNADAGQPSSEQPASQQSVLSSRR